MLRIIDLTYKVPLTEVDKYLTKHRTYLQKYYDLGYFIASGSKEPRTGGIIIAVGSVEFLNEVIKGDPFFQNDIADYNIESFHAVKQAQGFSDFLSTLAHDSK